MSKKTIVFDERSTESLKEEIECLEERLCEKDDQIMMLKHIIGLMGRVIDE